VKQIAREAAVRGRIPLVAWVAAETETVDAGPPDAGPPVIVASLGIVEARRAGCTSAPMGLIGLLGAVFFLRLRRR
jgi:hypothetical protein